MNLPKIHCKNIAYRSGFISVQPDVHPGHINLEVWHLHPDYDREATDIADERIAETDVHGNTELELNIAQAHELVRLLKLAIEAAGQHDDSDDASTALDDEDLAAIAALTAVDLKAIDDAIVAQLSGHWQKTALVVSRAMDVYPDKYLDVPDVFYGERVVALADKGDIEAQGNIRRMRFSEVRARKRDVENS